MGVFEILSQKEDSRKGSYLCVFNGYLEDYRTDMPEGTAREVFGQLLEKDESLRIIAGLNITVLNETISNAIIRYKDIAKYKTSALTIPYILYGRKEDREKAIVITEDDYLYAKGLYYVLTEPGSEFRDFNNDIVALTLQSPEDILSAFDDLYVKRGGQIQRAIDRLHFTTYDIAFEKAVAMAEELGDNVTAKADEAQDKEAFIRDRVGKWFLLKKFAYVQYMMEKDLLNTRHGGNIKLQRNKAKENADAIRFVSISEMWRGKDA